MCQGLALDIQSEELNTSAFAARGCVSCFRTLLDQIMVFCVAFSFSPKDMLGQVIQLLLNTCSNALRQHLFHY